MKRSIQLLAATGLALVGTAPPVAIAGESYDNCTGFIDALPAVIATPGTWCLRKDLATAITTGIAVNVIANSITIDCNGFKIGGLAAGPTSVATGIRATDRQNTTVRNCSIRGFFQGVNTTGGAGSLVEDSRLDGNLAAGINLVSEQSTARRNHVSDTGGSSSVTSFGISVIGDVIDNTVDVVYSKADVAHPYGILTDGLGSEIRGNRVRGLVIDDNDVGYGIHTIGYGTRVVDNHVALSTEAKYSHGVNGVGDLTSCSGNVVVNFGFAYTSCEATSNNLTLP